MTDPSQSRSLWIEQNRLKIWQKRYREQARILEKIYAYYDLFAVFCDFSKREDRLQVWRIE